MSALQKQDQDLPDPYSLRGEVAIPGVGLYEYCGKNVHEEIRDLSPLIYFSKSVRLKIMRRSLIVTFFPQQHGSLHILAFVTKRTA